jgi:hypothetical protein
MQVNESEISNFISKLIGGTQDSKKTKLTAGEASNLWTQYMGDSLGTCVYKYFLNIVEDEEIKSILESALALSQKHIKEITQFFNQCNFQIPLGLTEEDLDLTAPRLFSDSFLLYYTEIMTIHGLTGYSLAITTSESKPIRDHFIGSATSATELLDKTIQLFQSRGQYSGSPNIPPPNKIEFLEKKNFLQDFFGDPKPLNASEINNLFFNLKKIIFTKSMVLAFGQVSKSHSVRDYMSEANKMVDEHLESLASILRKDNLPTPRIWDAEVTASTTSPFSDKLIMLHTGFLFSSALVYYGTAMASTLRADVTAAYSKAITDILRVGNNWLTITVENQWLEKQPEAIDRSRLSDGEQ